MADEKLRTPEQVAKLVLAASIERLEYFSHCDFCRAGDCDDDGGGAIHTDDCPLYGYDMTADVERLKDWANPCVDCGDPAEDGGTRCVEDERAHRHANAADYYGDDD